MANPLFLASDIPSITYTGFNDDPLFPATNLNSFDRTLKWQPSVASSDTWLRAYVLYGLPYDTQKNYAVVYYHNLEALRLAGGRFFIQRADDVNFTVNLETLHDSNITYPVTDPLVVHAATTNTKNYWRVYIYHDPSHVVIPYFGLFYVGKTFDPGACYVYPYVRGDYYFDNQESTMLDGTDKAIQYLPGYGSRLYKKIKFELMTSTFWSNFGMYQLATHGKARPWFFEDVDGYTPNFVRFDSDQISIDSTHYEQYNTGEIGIKLVHSF